MIPPKIEKEIKSIHQYFEDWYNGSCPKDDDEFYHNVEKRFTSEFKIIMPDGTLYNKPEIIEVIKKGHGSASDFKIKIKMISTTKVDNNFLALYEEWHFESEREPEARISTVLLKSNAALEYGYEWIHCHEAPLLHK